LFFKEQRYVVALTLAIMLAFSFSSGVLAKTKVTVWTHGHLVPEYQGSFGAGGMKAAVERFETLYPDITLELVGNNDLESLLVAIAGGSPPNVAIVDRFLLASLAAQGYFQPVDEYLERAGAAVGPENMPPAAWEELHGFDDKLYGVPCLLDNVGFWSLYYNRRIFSESGVDPDSPPESWQDLRLLARKMTQTKTDGTFQQVGYQRDWVLDLHHFARSNQACFVSSDGREIILNSEKIVDTCEFLIELGERMGGWAAVDASGMQFENDQVAMRPMGEWYLWNLTNLEDVVDFDVAFIPTPTGDQFTAWIGGWAYAMPAGVDNPEASARVLAFLTSRELAESFIKGAQDWADSNNELMVLPGAFYFTYPDIVKEYHVPSLQYSAPRTVNALNHFLTARDRVYKTYSRRKTPIQNDLWLATHDTYNRIVIQQEASPRTILDEVTRTLQAKLDEAWKNLGKPAE